MSSKIVGVSVGKGESPPIKDAGRLECEAILMNSRARRKLVVVDDWVASVREDRSLCRFLSGRGRNGHTDLFYLTGENSGSLRVLLGENPTEALYLSVTPKGATNHMSILRISGERPTVIAIEEVQTYRDFARMRNLLEDRIEQELNATP